jgi:hypothetical protein
MPTPEELARQNIDATMPPHNGQVSATICLIPDQDGASCQGGGLVLRLTREPTVKAAISGDRDPGDKVVTRVGIATAEVYQGDWERNTLTPPIVFH